MAIYFIPYRMLNSLNRYFDQIYVCNLLERRNRWERVGKQLLRKGIKVRRAAAIDGRQSPYFQQWRSLSLTRKDFKIRSPGAWGYLHSIRVILEDAIRAGHRSVLLFDDDIILSQDLDLLMEKFMSRVGSDWVLLYLGASQEKYWDKIKVEEGYYHATGFTNGSFAVGIDQSVFRRLIYLIDHANLPLDSGPLRTIQKHFPSRCYVAYPNIVIADVRDSDIQDTPPEPCGAYAIFR